MHRVYILALFVAMVAVVAMAADKEFSEGPMTVKIMGKGGSVKITATKTATNTDNGGDSSQETETTPEPESDQGTTEAASSNRKRRAAEDDEDKSGESDLETNVVEIMLTSLQEIDADGNVVGGSKTESKALASFEDETFTFAAAVEDSTIPNSKKTDSDTTAVSAYEQSYTNEVVTIFIYIAKEDGTITLGSGDDAEKTEVKQGQIRFAIHIGEWVWCTEADGNCMNGETKQVGAFLEMVVAVKGDGEATKGDAEAGMSQAWDIGNDNMLYVSSMIEETKTDDSKEFVAMTANYPKIEKAANEEDVSTFTMRFGPYDKAVLYGSDVRLKIPGGEGVSSGSTLAASLAVVMLALLAALLRV